VRGRAYTSKKTGEEDYFTSLDAWKIERVGSKQERKTDGKGERSQRDMDDIPW